MATSRDAQDILDLKQTDSTARPKKKGPKPKLVRPAHIPKEVWLLETQGDRAPPIALTTVQPKKPKFTRRVKPWEWQPFTHPNRKDRLVLRHWEKKPVAADTQSNGPATPADGAANVVENKATQAEPVVAKHWAKYNINVDVPKYTPEQYEKHLRSDDWSKEETDYLLSAVVDFDLRWVVIADRYDYQPAHANTNGDEAMALVPASKPRTMEDLKARYYKVASVMMAVHQPLSSMTQAEFTLHEKMTKFDAAKEARRKRMAEQLLERTDTEIEEEKRLLAELKRIVQEEDDFIADRQELYERLAAPSSRGNVSMYESSAGLVQLSQQLAQQDRNRSRHYQLQQQQRRQIAGLGDDKDKSNSPAAPPTAGLQRGNSDLRRSIDGSATGRKDNKGGQHTFVQRQLSEREERKFGVQRPEKLHTGEKIRHLRIERRVTARASSVAAKVQDSMVELGIPIKPVMATQRITEGYEQLCSSLDLLLDTKRMTEKVENEIKVLKQQKEARENKTGEGQVDGASDDKPAQPNGDSENADAEDTQKASDTAERQDGHRDDEDDDEEDNQDNADVDADEEEDEAEAGSGGDDENDAEEEDDEDEDNDEDENDDTPVPDTDDADETGNLDVESRPSTRASGRKRSVSVLSSAPSQKSTKRQRK